MTLTPIFDTFNVKPTAQSLASISASSGAVIRDQFTLTTWLMIGAFLQGLLCLLPYRNLALIAPAFCYIAFHSTRTVLQCYGLIKNPNMDGVVEARVTPVLPNQAGVQENAADAPVCTLHIAARSNHPLGMFGPGMKEVGDYFNSMNKELDQNATQAGFLGSTSWLSACDRGYKSEIMDVMYFRTAEDVHNYAHGPLHTEALQWWSKNSHKWPHISLMHEIFAAPKKQWEAIYLNYHPTGMGATSKEVEIGGRKVWMNPLVKAKGSLLYSKGRMGTAYSAKEEWPEFEATIANKDYFDEKK